MKKLPLTLKTLGGICGSQGPLERLDWALHHQTRLHPAGEGNCLDDHHSRSGRLQMGLSTVS